MKNTLLLILDGLGISKDSPANALSQANIPTLKKLLELPQTLSIEASGRAVGLPAGFIGNSEVGHLNIGAGTIVYQDMTKIDVAIEDDSFFSNPVIKELLENTKKKNGRVHFMGLLSDGGVHSHINHLFALLKFANQEEVPAYVHAFMDGRDTAPTSGIDYIKALLPQLETNKAKLASICGRFYVMDRDKRWERVQEAYELLAEGKALHITDPIKAIEDSYSQDVKDEFIKPMLLDKEGILQDNDSVFFFNFRADRAKEICFALSDPNLYCFNRKVFKKLSGIAGMTQYDSCLNMGVAFPKQNLKDTVGERISCLNIPQLRIAETEKYAHVTYFLNGGREEPFPLEDRILIPSPRDVATYDLKPEMAAVEVTDTLIEQMQKKKYPFIVCNLANPDMVGHTGVMEAAIKALEVVDTCLEKILKEIKEEDWKLILLADHGNVEEMFDEQGQIHTAHTLNKVPLLVMQGDKAVDLDPTLYTKLADVAKLI